MKPFGFFDLYKICLDAGNEILDVYAQDFDVSYKADHSPLTLADRRAHAAIMRGLLKLNPALPVLSEEGKEVPFEERCGWSQYWLVDPLDGTKEFIKKNGEFTVNIALIDGKYPVLGMIYAPALDVLYFGRAGEGAFKLENVLEGCYDSEAELIQASVRLPGSRTHRSLCVVASRSHMSEETETFIADISAKHGNVDLLSSGSSLKFCLVAEGKADYYPRYAPTMEWDTAAGQAIVEATGGTMCLYGNNNRFEYNKRNLTNGWFLVNGVRTANSSPK